MSRHRQSNGPLLAEPQALEDYFGDLLDAPEPAPAEQEEQRPAENRHTRVAEAPAGPRSLMRDDILEPVQAPVEAPASPPASPPAPEVPAGASYPRPEKPFSALVIEAGPLTLLAPLADLGGVAPLDQLNIRPTPAHSPWYLGIADSKQGRVQLIDLAAIVTPADREYEPDTARQVVFLANSRFALACRAIHGTRTIDPEQLRWRSERRRLPWLAGVDREKMATLLDLTALHGSLEAGDWESGQG